MPKNKLFNEWTNVVAEDRNELVFENRNKFFGAYQLRRNYNKILALALIITVSAFIVLVSIPKIISLIQGSIEEEVAKVDITAVDLTPPPPLDETTPPPPPPPPPPPVQATIKFTPPVVTDEEVVEDPPPVAEEIDKQISTQTNEGDGSEDVIIPDDNAGDGPVAPVYEEPMLQVEKMPEFPGGEAKLMEFLYSNLQYPAFEKEAGISGSCYLTFVVEKDGSITGIRVLKGVPQGSGCDQEALRVLKKMPAWKPGNHNGRAVRVQFNLPIKFTLR